MTKALSALLFLAVLSPAALALQPGVYQTTGKSHYKDGALTLTAWAHKFKVTGQLQRGARVYSVEAWLNPVSGYFRGDGLITVRYPNGTGCQHRFGLKAYPQGNGFYLEENTPKSIPYNPNGPCTAAGPYVWFHHEAPYVKVSPARMP